MKNRSKLPVVLAFLICIAAAAGGYYVFKYHGEDVSKAVDDFLSKKPEKKPKTGPKSKKGKKKKKTDPAKKDRSPVEKPPEEPEPPPVDLERLEAMFTEAENHYKEIRYEKAGEVLGDLLESAVPGPLKEKAKNLRAKCRTFGEMVDGIKPMALSDLQDIVRIHLVNGHWRMGKVLSRSDKKIVIQEDNGIKAHLPMEEIDRVEPLDPEKVRKVKETMLAEKKSELEGKVGKGKLAEALICFKLAEFCIKHGLFLRVNGFLDEGMGRSAEFPALVYNDKAKTLYRSYLYWRLRKMTRMAKIAYTALVQKFPESAFSRLARTDEEEKPTPAAAPPPDENPAPEEPSPSPGETEPPPSETPEEDPPFGEEEPPPDEEPPTPAPEEPSTGRDLIDQARKLMRQGKAHEDRARPGSPNADEENEKAIGAYEKALELLEKALTAHPESAAWIETRIEEIQSALYWCKKMRKLG
jgi:hypothetical protein